MVKKFLQGLKKKFSANMDYVGDEDTMDDEYVELDTESVSRTPAHSKIIVRPFVIEDFSDIKAILDSLREGYTIALINIQPLKDKDLVELKRAINKLKKTCDAIHGDIAGFGDDYIVITPNFAEIYRTKKTSDIEEEF